MQSAKEGSVDPEPCLRRDSLYGISIETPVQSKIRIDHLWLVSVLNDPERFPELSSLSYGRADPVTFNARKFLPQQRTVATLVDRCLSRLASPGLVTTTVEEVVWVAEWCHRRGNPLPHRPADVRVAYRRRSYLSGTDRMKGRSGGGRYHGAREVRPRIQGESYQVRRDTGGNTGHSSVPILGSKRVLAPSRGV